MKSSIKQSKVNSLNIIKKNFGFINIPKYIYFTSENLKKNKNFYLNKIKNNFKTDIIVRSSALDEDTHKYSNAGKYEVYNC